MTKFTVSKVKTLYSRTTCDNLNMQMKYVITQLTNIEYPEYSFLSSAAADLSFEDCVISVFLNRS